jgi:D-alanyl-D-alanine dipeptidase
MALNAAKLKLESDAPTLFEMLDVPIKECDDPFASLKQAGFPYVIYDQVLPPSTGDDIFVRGGVLLKLQAAQSLLKTFPDYEGFQLQVTYGYRSPEIQHQKYLEQLQRFYAANLQPSTLMELANVYIACPLTAGHPCGAAIDLWIIDHNGEPLDFGTPMHDLSSSSAISCEDIPKTAYSNRMALRACMMAAGFAPYNGEWWHFSYGDREHAAWFNAGEAFYAPHSFNPSEQSFALWDGNKFDFEKFIKTLGENND